MLGVCSGSNHCRRYCAKLRFMQSQLHVERRSSYPKHRIDRRFEPRSQDGVDSLKHGRLAHIRSQFSLFRRFPTHKNLPLATFCTSEQLLLGSFCRSKKNKTVSLSGAFHCMESTPLSGQHAARAKNFRGFANLESMHRKGGFHKPIKTFFRRAEIHGASRRRPLPVHAKRVTGLLRKHS